MNGRIKNVLIIADLSYSSPRIPGLCKYLLDSEWRATILTMPLGMARKERLVVPNNYARIIEVPYRSVLHVLVSLLGFKANQGIFSQLEQKFPSTKKSLLELIMPRLIALGGALFAYPDEMRGWRRPAIQAAKKLLAEEKFDAILSSSFPITSHLIAYAIAKETRLPWLADLRDLWTQNHNYLFPKRKLIETWLEKRILSKAHALSTVSDSLSRKLHSRYQETPIAVIPNGFDADLINKPAAPLTEEFTITYTGLIYKDKQNPAKLFEALHDLLSDGTMDRTKVRVRFYGATQKWVAQLASTFHLQDIVMQHRPILRNEALAKQRESHVLLLCGWEDEYETGVLPLKMFEYFAARRPILATGGTAKEQFRAILDTTQAGKHAMYVNDIKRILNDYYREYIEKRCVTYHGIPEAMDQFSYHHMAKKFSDTLNQMITHDR